MSAPINGSFNGSFPRGGHVHVTIFSATSRGGNASSSARAHPPNLQHLLRDVAAAVAAGGNAAGGRGANWELSNTSASHPLRFGGRQMPVPAYAGAAGEWSGSDAPPPRSGSIASSVRNMFNSIAAARRAGSMRGSAVFRGRNVGNVSLGQVPFEGVPFEGHAPVLPEGATSAAAAPGASPALSFMPPGRGVCASRVRALHTERHSLENLF